MRARIGTLSGLALILLAGMEGPSLARVLARGAVVARKTRKFVLVRHLVRMDLLYDSGRIVLKRTKVLHFKSRKKLYPMDGRFELRGYRRGKLVMSWHMDFPFLGRTAVYSRRDRRLMGTLQRHVRSRATVLVPLGREWDKLEIKDLVSGHRTLLFVKRKGPMCRTVPRSRRPGKGAIHVHRGRPVRHAGGRQARKK